MVVPVVMGVEVRVKRSAPGDEAEMINGASLGESYSLAPSEEAEMAKTAASWGWKR